MSNINIGLSPEEVALNDVLNDVARLLSSRLNRNAMYIVVGCLGLGSQDEFGAGSVFKKLFTHPEGRLINRFRTYYDIASRKSVERFSEVLTEPVTDAPMPISESNQDVVEAAELIYWWYQSHSSMRRTKGRKGGPYMDMVQTGQEIDTICRAVADGRKLKNWKKDTVTKLLTYTPKLFNHGQNKQSHVVQRTFTEEEDSEGTTLDALEEQIKKLSGRTIPAIHQILSELKPGGWIDGNGKDSTLTVDLNQLMKEIGWNPSSSEERNAFRKEIYDTILFLAHAEIQGKRTTPYKDTKGNLIDTKMAEPIWTILPPDSSEQTSKEAVPNTVRLSISPIMYRLLTNSSTAQYLDDNKVLTSLPHRDKARGSWAMVIGYTLVQKWRREPAKALDGTLELSREEILTWYRPHISDPDEILKGKNPNRALVYWVNALSDLCEKGFLDPTGEAHPDNSVEKMKDKLPARNWQNKWLKEKVILQPGPAMKARIEERAKRRRNSATGQSDMGSQSKQTIIEPKTVGK